MKTANQQPKTSKTFEGFLWLFSSSGARSLLQLLITGVLARLLTPDDFGVVAAAMVVVFFTEFIYEMGVGPAIVQFKDITKQHIDVAFTFSVILGFSLALLFYLINPFLARFFEMPALESALNYLVWIFPMRTISQLSYSFLQREMGFKKIAGSDVASYAVGYGFVGVTLAYLDYGIWSLIAANLCQAFVYCLLLIRARRHSVHFNLNFSILKDLIKVGAGFSMAQIFNILARKADYLVVGKFLGAANLGIYSKSYALMNAPNNIAGTVMSKVMFASFSKKQDSNHELTSATQKSYAILFLITIPFGAFAIVLAPEIIRTLLGPNWDASIMPFQILVGFTCFRIGYKVGSNLLKGLGKVYLLSFTQFIYLVLVLIGSYWGSFYGISGVAIGVSVAILVNFIILVGLSFKYTSVSWLAFVGSFFRPLLLSVFFTSGLYFLVEYLRSINLQAVLIIVLCAFFAGSIILLFSFVKKGILIGEHGVWFRDQMLSLFNKKTKVKKKKQRVD